MKKVIILLMALSVPFVATSQNLGSSSAEVTVSATVQAALTIDVASNLAFGTYTAGTGVTPVVNPDPNSTPATTTAANAQRGRVDLSGGTASAAMTFSGPTTVNLGSGGDPLDEDDWSLDANLTYWYVGAAGASISPGGTLNLTAAGEGTLYIGGTLAATTTQPGQVSPPAASYSETITLTFTYD
jgi:spore coat protein U-like protein